jgi:hypothetical protein
LNHLHRSIVYQRRKVSPAAPMRPTEFLSPSPFASVWAWVGSGAFGFDDSQLKTLGMGKRMESNSDAGWRTVQLLIDPAGSEAPTQQGSTNSRPIQSFGRCIDTTLGLPLESLRSCSVAHGRSARPCPLRNLWSTDLKTRSLGKLLQRKHLLWSVRQWRSRRRPRLRTAMPTQRARALFRARSRLSSALTVAQ